MRGLLLLGLGALFAVAMPGACGKACGGPNGDDGGPDASATTDAGGDSGVPERADAGLNADAGADAGEGADGGSGAGDDRFPDGGWVTADWLAADQRFVAALQSGAANVSDGTFSVHRAFTDGGQNVEEWSVDGQLAVRVRFGAGQSTTELFEDEASSRRTRMVEETRSPDGSVRRRVTSYPGDDSPDTRETYTWHPGDAEILVALEEDDNHDGSWANAGSETRPAVDQRVVINYTLQFPDCENKLDKLLEAAKAANEKCFKALLPRKAAALKQALEGSARTIVIQCKAFDGPAAVHNPDDSIDVNAGAANDPSLGPTLFHELLHLNDVFGPHKKGSGLDDPADQVWGCEWACFGKGDGKDNTPPTSQECAQCRGTTNPDAKCKPKRYPYKPCPDVLYCCVDGKPWPKDQEQQCVAACPASLKICQPICGPWAPSGPCRPSP